MEQGKIHQSMLGNPMRYVWFTALYNARAYYPVLAILFLDLGLSLDQYVMLNLIWAATIFLFEVPSGALADTLGRKQLLILSSLLMVAEMLCLLLAPKDGGMVLFLVCALNRFLSGLSEAAASGADEALAYDSLPEKNRKEAWDGILARAMRLRSIGFVIAMVLGGLCYDPSIINQLLPHDWQISKEIAHRLPVMIVLLQGIVCVGISEKMVEPKRESQGSFLITFQNTWRMTLSTAKWVFTTRISFVVVLVGMAIDSAVRNFATITSGYYRLIDLPEWTYGFIGASFGLFGYLMPGIATKMNQRFGIMQNFALIAGISLLGLIGIAYGNTFLSLIPACLLMTSLGMLGFTISRALHQAADSERRATVLSVKGLAFNLSYGCFSLCFSLALASWDQGSADLDLRKTLFWQIPFYALLVAALLIWGRAKLKTESAKS